MPNPASLAATHDTPRALHSSPRNQAQPRPNTDLELLRRRYRQVLERLCGGEQEHLHVLPAMAKVAQRPALQDAFRYHYEKTLSQAERLATVCAALGLRPVTLTTRPAGLSQAARPWSASSSELAGCDDVLITAARQLEHREIADYLVALHCAESLRDQAAVELLEQTLQEEYEADLILAALEAEMTERRPGQAEPPSTQPSSTERG